MTRNDIKTLRTSQLLSIIDHGNPAEDVIPERSWASEELFDRIGRGEATLVYRPGPNGRDRREFEQTVTR